VLRNSFGFGYVLHERTIDGKNSKIVDEKIGEVVERDITKLASR
jgi:hypothetical protein